MVTLKSLNENIVFCTSVIQEHGPGPLITAHPCGLIYTYFCNRRPSGRPQGLLDEPDANGRIPFVQEGDIQWIEVRALGLSPSGGLLALRFGDSQLERFAQLMRKG